MRKTLLILGAGASKDIYRSFPTGLELIKQINQRLSADKFEPDTKGKGPYLSAVVNELTRAFTNDEKFIGKAISRKDIEDRSNDGMEKFFYKVRALKTILHDHVDNHEHKELRDYNNVLKSISIDSFVSKNFRKNNTKP